MIKLLGAVCVLGGGFWVGRAKIAERRKRQIILEDFIDAFRRMGEEIRMMRTPLPALLKQAANTCGSEVSEILTAVSQAAGDGEAPDLAWRTLIDKLPLSQEERSVIAEVGNNLYGDEESICKAISLAGYRLAQYAEKLHADRRPEEQRVAALSFSAAALLVILLI